MPNSEDFARLRNACAILGEHELERHLLDGEVKEVRLFRSQTADTYELIFEGSKAAFKSLEGNDKDVTEHYGHSAVSAMLNDVAAWLVARGMGIERLVLGVVIRTCSAAGASFGSTQTWFAAEPGYPGWEESDDVRDAAIFDAVIAHQDRHTGNFSFDPDTGEIGLFDNSFAFALPGHAAGASEILRVCCERGADLSIDEAALLHRYNTSPERALLRTILAPDRWQGVEARVTNMLATRSLLRPFEY